MSNNYVNSESGPVVERDPVFTLHMYVWSHQPFFIAIAHARTVAEARKLVLLQIGESGDGSCPERDKAREWVLSRTPNIWHGANAEFALTDSAELVEAENQSEKRFQLLKQVQARIVHCDDCHDVLPEVIP